MIFYQSFACLPLFEHKNTCAEIFYVLLKCIEFLFIVNYSLYGHYGELVFVHTCLDFLKWCNRCVVNSGIVAAVCELSMSVLIAYQEQSWLFLFGTGKGYFAVCWKHHAAIAYLLVFFQGLFCLLTSEVGKQIISEKKEIKRFLIF